VTDFPRTLWGSSVRVLQRQRDGALAKEFLCAQNECFDAVFAMTDSYREHAASKTQDRLLRHMFDPDKGYIVVMRVPDAVDTTEVGIFFDRWHEGSTRVEISSLSTHAKQKVSEMVFGQLGSRFETVGQ